MNHLDGEFICSNVQTEIAIVGKALGPLPSSQQSPQPSPRYHTGMATDWELVYEPSYGALKDLGRLANETRERILAIVSIALKILAIVSTS